MNKRQLLVSTPIVIAVLVAARFITPQLWGAESTARGVSLKDGETAIRKLFEQAVAASSEAAPRPAPPQWQLTYTTWLPNEWPPSPQTTWSRYAYGLDVALDGACDVSAPIARLERSAADPRRYLLVPMARTITRIGTHAVRPRGGWNYTLEDEQWVLNHAFALTGLPPAGARGSIGLVSYFQSWKLGNTEIATHVSPQHRAFFKWLKKQPVPAKFPQSRSRAEHQIPRVAAGLSA